MQRLEAIERDDTWVYLFNGEEVTNARIIQDYRAPHSMILVNGEHVFDVEYVVDGVLREIVPNRNPSTEAVYAAIESGDWSNVSTAEGVGSTLRELSAAEDALRASRGRRADSRWASFQRMVQVYLRNHSELMAALDQVEGRATSAMTTGLLLDDSLLLSQRTYNNMVACASLRDQIEETFKSEDYVQNAFKKSVLDESGRLWGRPEMDFLLSLRNASVHMYQIGQGLEVEIGRDATHARIVIQPRQLLKQPPHSLKEGKPGYRFAEQNERIDLREFADTARQLATNFARWALAEAERHHTADQEDAIRLQADLDSVLSRLHGQPVQSTVQPPSPFKIRWDPPETT